MLVFFLPVAYNFNSPQPDVEVRTPSLSTTCRWLSHELRGRIHAVARRNVGEGQAQFGGGVHGPEHMGIEHAFGGNILKLRFGLASLVRRCVGERAPRSKSGTPRIL